MTLNRYLNDRHRADLADEEYRRYLRSQRAALETTLVSEDSTTSESLRSPGLPGWQRQKSYQKARDKLVHQLRERWYADITPRFPGRWIHPLITWSGTWSGGLDRPGTGGVQG